MSIAPSAPGQPEPTQHRPRLYSGMQPTSDSLHLGNYLGALRNWVDLQENYDSIFCVVDLHSLTVRPDPNELRIRTRRTAAQYIAGGIDPEKSILYLQSHVPEHAQLAWVLNCITGFGEASRMTQFKDKSAKQGTEGTTVGLFAYPVLMAADILLYDTEKVPTGEDQRQHVELSRDLAQRFNARYGQTVVVPEAHIVKSTAKIQDLQDPAAKMSKSSSSPQGIIDLLDEPKIMAKRIKSAVTDTDPEMAVYFNREEKPGISNLLTIYSALSNRPVDEIAQEYTGRGYGYLKKDLSELVVETLAPFREQTFALLDDQATLDRILADGACRARAIAHETLARIHDRLGLLPATAQEG